jgi:hypothetical protein
VQRCFFDTHAVGAADGVIHTDTLQREGERERGRIGGMREGEGGNVRGMKWVEN